MFLSYMTLKDTSLRKTTVNLLGNFGVIYSVKKLEGRFVQVLSLVILVNMFV